MNEKKQIELLYSLSGVTFCPLPFFSDWYYISLNVVLMFNPPPEMLIGYILILQFDRLWAEVFHVSTSSAGTVRWQQISEDLVPVNISCIQDHPDYVFHITAYNSQVDKILDVRLNQPGRELLMAFPH